MLSSADLTLSDFEIPFHFNIQHHGHKVNYVVHLDDTIEFQVICTNRLTSKSPGAG